MQDNPYNKDPILIKLFYMLFYPNFEKIQNVLYKEVHPKSIDELINH